MSEPSTGREGTSLEGAPEPGSCGLTSLCMGLMVLLMPVLGYRLAASYGLGWGLLGAVGGFLLSAPAALLLVVLLLALAEIGSWMERLIASIARRAKR